MAEADLNPEELARNVALSVASRSSEVGDFIVSLKLEDEVYDYRFDSHIKGYEGWQWSVTLYHDQDAGTWTVDESSLVPSAEALQPPRWIPWKDRLLPSDLSVTDAMGTDPDDPRLVKGYVAPKVDQPAEQKPSDGEAAPDSQEIAGQDTESEAGWESDAGDERDGDQESGAIFRIADESDAARSDQDTASEQEADENSRTSEEDLDEVVDELALSRRHVMTAEARAATAKRWYEGQHGPKSLSTRTAKGNACGTCGFMVPLKGELGTMFAVCANRWSPDDGRVVSLDHGCGEHSEIQPQEETHLWVQSQPAFDDLHIDVVRQKPREERPEVELMEELTSDEDEADLDQD
ncbi:DUF3027 domain-containing protein [uncultured Bifidobacterium sp.]|uniref:DUF3027 domain-containing protein n=1 Tax=uncultured Bifidobacterium sp. TaxID=165187 RepID=UPI00260477F8|nr:DUF3027 domain-containing protein [uncultured Bifidobacterium sp.]